MNKKHYLHLFKSRRSPVASVASNTQHYVYRTPYKIHNLKWDFHKYDDDFFPSVPHGHCEGYKLDVVDGLVYDKNNKKSGQLKKKEIDKLKKDPKFIKLARDAIEYYKMKYPERDIKTPDWINDSTSSLDTCSYFRPMCIATVCKNNSSYSIVLKTEIK